jgi:hypothetical protein
MAVELAPTGTNAISFLNRDHIISVTIDHGEIIVHTTVGTQMTFPASPSTLEKFADELANSARSNFVTIASTPAAIAAR